MGVDGDGGGEDALEDCFHGAWSPYEVLWLVDWFAKLDVEYYVEELLETGKGTADELSRDLERINIPAALYLRYNYRRLLRVSPSHNLHTLSYHANVQTNDFWWTLRH